MLVGELLKVGLGREGRGPPIPGASLIVKGTAEDAAGVPRMQRCPARGGRAQQAAGLCLGCPGLQLPWAAAALGCAWAAGLQLPWAACTVCSVLWSWALAPCAAAPRLCSLPAVCWGRSGAPGLLLGAAGAGLPELVFHWCSPCLLCPKSVCSQLRLSPGLRKVLFATALGTVALALAAHQMKRRRRRKKQITAEKGGFKPGGIAVPILPTRRVSSVKKGWPGRRAAGAWREGAVGERRATPRAQGSRVASSLQWCRATGWTAERRGPGHKPWQRSSAEVSPRFVALS